MRSWNTLVAGMALALGLALLPAAAVSAPAGQVRISGTAQFDATVTAQWDGTGTPTFQWLRDGKVISGATAAQRKLVGADVGRKLSVRATVGGHAVTSTAVTVRTKPLTRGGKPSISGQRRYLKKLTAHPGTWKASNLTFRYRWFRDGKAIRGKGSTKRTRVMSHQDVGKKISVRVTASKKHHTKTMGPVSGRTAVVRHQYDPRRTVTYSVVNDGSRLNMALTRKRVAAIYDDARGWRRGAVKFKQVKSGGHFTVVMAKASRVPRYSSACSTKWSCRVGRNVVINEDRWRGATRAWRGAKKSVRSYRHMVINHETGHWFGKGHVGCVGRGRAAPIMQQQSKGMQGCKPNPWPRTTEAASLRR